MLEAERGSNVLENWYRTRITEPDTPDEVYGYWTFALGIVLGIFGLLLFVVSSRGTPTQQSAIALSAIALVLLIVGPVVRLPLEARATRIAQAGALIAFAAVIWFTFAYPGWRDQSAQIVSLYAIGLGLVAVGAVLVPVFSPAREFDLDADRDAERAAAAEAAEEARARVEELEAENEALTDELTDRDASKAAFELYEDRAGKWRWRLRHRNTNVVADGGQGYSSRSKAHDAIDSVKRNGPNAATEAQ